MSPARGGALENREAGTEKEGEARGSTRHSTWRLRLPRRRPMLPCPSLLPPLAGLLLGYWDTGHMVFELVCSIIVAMERREAHHLSSTCKEHLWFLGLLVASVGNNIAIQIAAGSSLKALYKNYHTARNGAMPLQQFILLFGAFELFLSQLPDIHFLRWVNAMCTASTIAFAGTSIGVTIYDGYWIGRKKVNYSLQGSTATKIFRAFNALGTIAFSFGDVMLPEIQSTVREPVRANMYKGVSAAYTIIVMSYWTLAFSGYWAFGSEVQPYILSSLTAPRWVIVMANLFAVIQIAGCFEAHLCAL